MRRREKPTGSMSVPPQFRAPAVVEDWVSADEITAIDRGGAPSALEFLAWRRWRAARDEWLEERGVVPRDRLAATRDLSMPDGRPRWRERANAF